MGSKSDVNNDLDESKKTTPLTHFGAPGRPPERQKKIWRGPEPPSTSKKKKSSKKWPQDELLNRTKINIGTKIQKKEGKQFEQKFSIIKMA